MQVGVGGQQAGQDGVANEQQAPKGGEALGEEVPEEALQVAVAHGGAQQLAVVVKLDHAAACVQAMNRLGVADRSSMSPCNAALVMRLACAAAVVGPKGRLETAVQAGSSQVALNVVPGPDPPRVGAKQ